LNKLKLGSLFDGIGGFPLSAQRHGIEPVWASEIEPFPIKVTQHHFPNMKHLGDITQINGAEIEPVDIITFGSPCQDLSVAGKREGLQGERSGLFMDAVRIIREMRRASGGEYPRFIVWENVPGAFSSNKGEDFRTVLSEIAEAEIPMPTSGKWAEAGMVRTERIDIAWRTLDAQYWGVPQRRKRIFLVADFTGQCAAEILFKPEGLRGNIAESREAGEEAAATVGDGIKTAVPINTQIATRHNALGERTGLGIGKQDDPAFTLQESHSHAVFTEVAQCVTTGTGRRFDPETETSITVLADQGGSQMSVIENMSPTLRAQEHGHQPLVMRKVSRTLRAEAGAPKCEADWESLVIQERGGHFAESRKTREGIAADAERGVRETSDCLTPWDVQSRKVYKASGKWSALYGGEGGGRGYVAIPETPKTMLTRCGKEDGGEGALVSKEKSLTLGCSNDQALIAIFAQNQRDEVRDLGDKTGALQAEPGMKQQTFVIQNATRGKSQNGLGISQDDVSYTLDSLGNHAVCIQGSMIGRADKNGPQGDGINEDVSFTLNTTDRHAVAYNAVATMDCRNLCENEELSGTIQAKENGGYSLNYQNPVRVGYAVRRLTPLECERLMGFPDGWTDIPGASDTARYKALGNSVAIPCVDFIMSRIAEVLRTK